MNKRNISKILSQPFTYLTEGLQTFVYISKDGKHVLKTLKNLEQSKEQFKRWGLNPDDITEVLTENSEKSYKLAFERLKKQTALEYVHISGERLSFEQIILDGKEYDSSTLQFILQEKVELVRGRIRSLMNDDNITEAKKVIDDIMKLISYIWKQDITEDTFNWDHNYGYTQSGTLTQIDVGTFWNGRKYLKEEIEKKKLTNSVSAKKLKTDFPKLYVYYQKETERLYNEFAYITTQNTN